MQPEGAAHSRQRSLAGDWTQHPADNFGDGFEYPSDDFEDEHSHSLLRAHGVHRLCTPQP